MAARSRIECLLPSNLIRRLFHIKPLASPDRVSAKFGAAAVGWPGAHLYAVAAEADARSKEGQLGEV